MISELDTVVLKRDLPEYGLTAGDVGAVVYVYDAEGAYEVEFVAGSGETIAVITMSGSDLRPLHNNEILHVRGLAA